VDPWRQAGDLGPNLDARTTDPWRIYVPLSSDGARTSSPEQQYEGEDDPAALETAKFMKALVDYKLGNGGCLTTEIQQMV